MKKIRNGIQQIKGLYFQNIYNIRILYIAKFCVSYERYIGHLDSNFKGN